jgi:hypothetical protein
LSGIDPQPQRVQIVELLPLEPLQARQWRWAKPDAQARLVMGAGDALGLLLCGGLNRAQAVAIELLGANFKGKLSTDRYGGYNWLELSQRQVC